jgi:hypothetical protein
MRRQPCVENSPGGKLTKAVQCQLTKGICRESLSQISEVDLSVLVTVKFQAKLKKFLKNMFFLFLKILRRILATF